MPILKPVLETDGSTLQLGSVGLQVGLLVLPASIKARTDLENIFTNAKAITKKIKQDLIFKTLPLKIIFLNFIFFNLLK